MKILILAAMEKELSLLISLLADCKTENIDKLEIHHGTLGNHEVFLTKCGIGKVNSALVTYKCCNLLNPDLVINSGVAGGAGLPVGVLFIPDQVAYHDVWCGPGTQYGEADGFPTFMLPDPRVLEKASESLKDNVNAVCGGLICSGDKFISTPEEIAYIRSNFRDVKAVDMESASIAQTCKAEGIPFAILRIVSDTPGEGENISQYENFWAMAPERTFRAVRDLIQLL